MVTCSAIGSKRLARVTPTAELVYWRVYFASDNYGTMKGEPWDVWQYALPAKFGIDEHAIGEALHELVTVGLLAAWLDDDGRPWVHVVGHDEHQSAEFLRKRGVRRSPAPPAAIVDAARLQGRPNARPIEQKAGLNANQAGVTGARSARTNSTSTIPIGDVEERDPRDADVVSINSSSITMTVEQLFTQVVDTLTEAGGTSTDRSMWKDLVDRYRRSHPDTPPAVFLDVAGLMLAKVRTSNSPFAYDRGASYWQRTFVSVRRDHAIADERVDHRTAPSGGGDATPHTDEWRQQIAASIGPLPGSAA